MEDSNQFVLGAVNETTAPIFNTRVMISLLKNIFIIPCLFTMVTTEAQDSTVIVTLDVNKTVQLIDNFGASGCWYSEGIGKSWPDEKKERIAELLFSRQMDNQGNPRGIGLSAWRFNIGGGTAEQGDSSGIKDVKRRVECFLNKDGSYNWGKQQGYVWFLKKAKQYGTEKLIAFSNTAPVQFTQNSLGYKTVKDYKANLKADKYDSYAAFLATVLDHFDKEGLHFDYISPVNEPQWDWSKKYGEGEQEGSPWANEDISRIVIKLDSALTQQKLSSRILLPEAAMLSYLYAGSGQSSQQVQRFFAKGQYQLAGLKHLPNLVAGHSYFTDAPDSNRIAIRQQLADTAKKYGVDFWQSEYCMLADGFREGTGSSRTAMDCALFLAKVIHSDLTIANATAWQYWNAYEPGKADMDTRYYLIALDPNGNNNFSITKNLWALGHYSLFIRPGMHRLQVDRSDHSTVFQDAQQLMISAFAKDKNEIVVVAINYSNSEKKIAVKTAGDQKFRTITKYSTTGAADENMKASSIDLLKGNILLAPRSISTLVMKNG